jgi:hypothetical protein
MARRDLTEAELRTLSVWSQTECSDQDLRSKIQRLIAEVKELRDREANAMHMAGLEAAY